MAEIKELATPPIVEAVLDLRVLPRQGLEAPVFRALCDELSESFPSLGEQKVFETEIKVGEAPLATHDRGLKGYRLTSSDTKEIAQLQVDGFTFGRLAPYTGWDEFYCKAWDVWDRYYDVASPRQVVRAALRFINRIGGPREKEQFEDFLTAGPAIPDGLPDRVSGFFSRVTIVDESGRFNVNLTQSLLAEKDKAAELLIDVDAFCMGVGSLPREKLPGIFESLRALKNRVFFSAVTEQALEPYL